MKSWNIKAFKYKTYFNTLLKFPAHFCVILVASSRELLGLAVEDIKWVADSLSITDYATLPTNVLAFGAN